MLLFVQIWRIYNVIREQHCKQIIYHSQWFEKADPENCAVFYVPANTVYGRQFLQVKRPNQQYLSTEGQQIQRKQPIFTN